MAAMLEQLEAVPGYSVPVHGSLSEPILLGGAPRAFAILNGTLAGAIGLGLQLWGPGSPSDFSAMRWRSGRRGAIRSSSRPGAGTCACPGISRSEGAR